jgi:hypothetical protein
MVNGEWYTSNAPCTVTLIYDAVKMSLASFSQSILKTSIKEVIGLQPIFELKRILAYSPARRRRWAIIRVFSSFACFGRTEFWCRFASSQCSGDGLVVGLGGWSVLSMQCHVANCSPFRVRSDLRLRTMHQFELAKVSPAWRITAIISETIVALGSLGFTECSMKTPGRVRKRRFPTWFKLCLPWPQTTSSRHGWIHRSRDSWIQYYASWSSGGWIGDEKVPGMEPKWLLAIVKFVETLGEALIRYGSKLKGVCEVATKNGALSRLMRTTSGCTHT